MPPQQKRAKCHPATAPRARLRPGLAPPQQPHLSPAPRRRPPQEMPPELENEGQHVQTVFPPDDALGGPGYFAFNPLAHMTEAHALATPASRARLEAEWGAHWDASKGVLLEKSPSNLLRARFLQALWPDCHFVFIVRHPLAHAYASAAWGTAHAGKGALASLFDVTKQLSTSSEKSENPKKKRKLLIIYKLKKRKKNKSFKV